MEGTTRIVLGRSLAAPLGLGVGGVGGVGPLRESFGSTGILAHSTALVS